jgi:hypothetical protein
VFESRVLRGIFGPKGEEVAGGWRRQQNEELHNLYSSPDIVRVIKSGKVGWAGHEARMSEMDAYNILVMLGDGRQGLNSWQKQGFFHFASASRRTLGPIQPPIQWVPRALSAGVKRPEREADHLPPSSAEIKNAWSYICTIQYVFLVSCLIKQWIRLQWRGTYSSTRTTSFLSKGNKVGRCELDASGSG